MPRINSLTALAVALAVVLTACGDDAADTTAPTTEAPASTEAPPPSTTAAPPSTLLPAAGPRELPTGVVAPLDSPYKWGDENGDVTADEIPFPSEGIEAHWYRTGDFLAVVFFGLDLDSTGPLCAGTSLGGARHASNAPTPGGSCEGSAAPILEAPEGIKICDGLVSYVTPIPADASGELLSTIEAITGTGINYGVGGSVPNDPDYMAEIDPASLEC